MKQKNYLKWSIHFFCLLFSLALKAQTPAIVKGTVLDSDGNPIAVATVIVSDDNGKVIQAAVSGEKGTFTINGLQAGRKYNLQVTRIGYQKQIQSDFRVDAGDNNSLLIRLETENTTLNSVVVVGYGTQNKKDVTTAISSVKSEEVNNYPAIGLDKALTGKIAGVQVIEQTGAPGSGIAIKVRGTSTITAGTMPLYVIDGVPLSDQENNATGTTVNTLNDLSMNDIESIDVLKDASASAIYGSRGSNGVVIITTKRGKKGKPKVSYNAFAGIQQTTRKIPMLDAYQYANLVYDSHNNAYLDDLSDQGKTGSITDGNDLRKAKVGNVSADLIPPDLLPYLNGEQGLTNTNWQDQVFRTAVQQSHSVSVAGGSDNIRYYVSGNYVNQDGIVIGSGFKKYNGRINLDASYNKLKLGTSVNITNSIYAFVPTEGRFNDENIVSSALAMSPTMPVYNADGSYNFDQYSWGYSRANVVNPVALAYLKSDRMNQLGLAANVFAQYEIAPALNFKSSFGINIKNWRRNLFRPSTLPNTATLMLPSVPTATSRTKANTNWVSENTLNYKKTFGDHSITALGGFTIQRESSDANLITGTGFQNDYVQTLNNATSITAWSSTIQEWSLVSALARVQYAYKGRYLLSAAIRSDGSSRFGPSSRWGAFPSASAGWNIADENFMRSISWISNLKLRASYGVTGNFSIGNYGYLSLLGSDNYIFGAGNGTLSPGYTPTTAGNDKLKWEKTASINVGADLGLFNDNFNIVFDTYSSNTSDMLLQLPVPSASGFTTALRNIGKVNNKGIELTLSTNHQLGKWKMAHSINFSANRNKVIDLGGVNSIVSTTDNVLFFITQVGQPIASYYTLVTNGVYKDQADVNNPANPKVAGARPGDFKFVDIDHNGVIDGNDKAPTGNYQPQFAYGYSGSLAYRNIDLAVALQGIQGNKIANIYKRYIDNMEGNTNNMTDALNRYTSPDNPGNGSTVRANRTAKGLNGTISTWHIEDGSYLRVRNITLGYTLPSRWLMKAGISKLRVFASTTNPFTVTNYSGYNPEVSTRSDNPLTPGVDYGTYPLAKTYNLGINIDL